MKEDLPLESQESDLWDYIQKNSEILEDKNGLTDELAGLALVNKGMLGYYDSKDIKFSVDGYDFVYFDKAFNLKHVKIRPDDLSGLNDVGKIGEGDEIAKKLEELGFVLDQSEKFRSALWRQLNV